MRTNHLVQREIPLPTLQSLSLGLPAYTVGVAQFEVVMSHWLIADHSEPKLIHSQYCQITQWNIGMVIHFHKTVL